MDALSDFGLPNDLVKRLLASIEELTARVWSPDMGEEKIDFLEIVMLVPSLQTPTGQTWGFFRVERSATDALNENAKEHCVEYYLYLDTRVKE
jgi:hypothetical protein